MNVKSGYGTTPIMLGHHALEFPEMMFYLYLPIKMAGEIWTIQELPLNLQFLVPLINAMQDEVEDDDYVYITAKNQWYEPGGTYNRPGWHTDGFMSDDINYIWADGPGTIVHIPRERMRLSQDHALSMEEMTQYITNHNNPRVNRNTQLNPCCLYKLDEKVIHRPPPVIDSGMRGFVKLSVSKNKYDLKGNSHNYLLDYDWEMKDRIAQRNDPVSEGE